MIWSSFYGGLSREGDGDRSQLTFKDVRIPWHMDALNMTAEQSHLEVFLPSRHNVKIRRPSYLEGIGLISGKGNEIGNGWQDIS